MLDTRYSITGKMTGKSYGPTEMIIRGLPGWLAWFAGGQPHPARQKLAAGIRGGRIRNTPMCIPLPVPVLVMLCHCEKLCRLLY